MGEGRRRPIGSDRGESVVLIAKFAPDLPLVPPTRSSPSPPTHGHQPVLASAWPRAARPDKHPSRQGRPQRCGRLARHHAARGRHRNHGRRATARRPADAPFRRTAARDQIRLCQARSASVMPALPSTFPGRAASQLDTIARMSGGGVGCQVELARLRARLCCARRCGPTRRLLARRQRRNCLRRPGLGRGSGDGRANNPRRRLLRCSTGRIRPRSLRRTHWVLHSRVAKAIAHPHWRRVSDCVVRVRVT